jgi:hypothetical protein
LPWPTSTSDALQCLHRCNGAAITEPGRSSSQRCLRFEPQRRGGGVVCHHTIDSRAAVVPVLPPVGAIDVRSLIGFVSSDILNGHIGLQARYADPRSPRVHHLPEPTSYTSVPGAYVHLPIDADDPYRYTSGHRPISTFSGDFQFFGRTDSLRLLLRPRGRHDMNFSLNGAVVVTPVQATRNSERTQRVLLSRQRIHALDCKTD